MVNEVKSHWFVFEGLFLWFEIEYVCGVIVRPRKTYAAYDAPRSLLPVGWVLGGLAACPVFVDGGGGGGDEVLVVGEGERVVGADDDDDVVGGGPIVLGEAEGLAEEALDAIAFDGGADFAGDAEAQAGVGEGVGLAEDGEEGGVLFCVGVVDGFIGDAAGEAHGAGEGVGGKRRFGLGWGGNLCHVVRLTNGRMLTPGDEDGT